MRLAVLSAPLLLALTTFAHSPLRRGVATDICANLNVHLVFPDVLVENKPYDAGRMHIGLCISQVDRLIEHYDVTEAATKVVGTDKVKSAVVDLSGEQCTYPPHSVPSVSEGNVCGFLCTDGFLAVPTNHPSSCVCPTTECDGKCGVANCSTKAPASRRQNEPTCAEGLTMCGVPDPTGKPFKCTNVASDPTTCGGCIKAAPFPGSSAGGIDCSKLPHVGEATCEGGKCVVQRCKDGFFISVSKDACVPQKVTPDGNAAVGTLSDKTVPGADIGGRVPRSDATSEIPGKDALGGVQSSVAKGAHIGKVRRGLAPIEGHARMA